jgi:hypothetical protein
MAQQFIWFSECGKKKFVVGVVFFFFFKRKKKVAVLVLTQMVTLKAVEQEQGREAPDLWLLQMPGLCSGDW